MKTRLTLCATVLIAARVCAQIPIDPTTGQMFGTIAAPDGTPLKGALVTIMRIPADGVPFVPVNRTELTADDGSFQLGLLPAGDYRICAQTRINAILNTCTWPEFESRATVVAQQMTKLDAIALPRAFRVQLHIADAMGALAASAKSATPPNFLVGAFAKSGLHTPMGLAQDSVNDHWYELWAPYGTPIQISVSSRTFSLAGGASSNAVRSVRGDMDQVDVDLTVVPGAEPGPILVNINGKK